MSWMPALNRRQFVTKAGVAAASLALPAIRFARPPANAHIARTYDALVEAVATSPDLTVTSTARQWARRDFLARCSADPTASRAAQACFAQLNAIANRPFHELSVERRIHRLVSAAELGVDRQPSARARAARHAVRLVAGQFTSTSPLLGSPLRLGGVSF
jgi:hypothetical protein